MDLPRYILITPAKNEEKFIEKTIKSVISQTVLPIKWIIVSDGSIDNTDVIVERYVKEYRWIELLRLPYREDRHFGGKARAFNEGYERNREITHDFVGNVDADISFAEDHFEFLLKTFKENPALGVAGTPFEDLGSGSYNYKFTSPDHVSGACQLFRRECFISIGGYTALKEGGIDLLAVIKARMSGWQTRTFLEKTCIHHRRMGTELKSGLGVAFWGGYHDYQMGVSLVWQVFRSIYQMSRKPYFSSGITILIGYLWGLITRTRRIVSKDIRDFRKAEQMRRLRDLLFQILRLGPKRND